MNPSSDHLKGKSVNDLLSKPPNGMASDLLKLILYPENELNSSITDCTVGTDISGDDKNNKISSAYSDILCRVFPTGMPYTSSCCLICSASGSRAKENNKGLSGHPCLIPLARGKGSDRMPLVITHAEGE